MKKTIVLLLMVCGMICSASAQTIISKTQSTVRVDYNMDGIWDREIDISRVPNSGYMHINHTLANELGRCYIINLWRQYRAQGLNPANSGLLDPYGEGDFTQYATAYSHLISGGMVGGIGMPGTASVGVQIGKVGIGVNIPVVNNNGLGGIFTPNATVGVNINGNGGVISLPVGVKVGSKKATRRQGTTTVPTATQRTRTSVATPTRSTDSVEMTVDEIQSMLSDSYM